MQMAAVDIAMPESPALAGGARNGQLEPGRDSPVVDVILEDSDVAEHTSRVHDHEQHLKGPTEVRPPSTRPALWEQQQQGGASGPAAGVAVAQTAEGSQPTLAGAGLCSSEARGPAWRQAQEQPAQGDQRLDEGFQLELEDDDEAGCSIIWEPVPGKPAVDAGWQAPRTQAGLQQQQQGLTEPLSSGRWRAAIAENRLPLQPAGALAAVGSGASPSSLLTRSAEQQQSLPGAGPAAALKRASMSVSGMTAPAADAPGYRSLSQAALDDNLSQMSEPDCPLEMESEGAQKCTWQQSWKQGAVGCDHALADDDCSVICVEDSATEEAGAQLQQKAAEDGPAALPGSDSTAANGVKNAQQPTASSWDAAQDAGEAAVMFALVFECCLDTLHTLTVAKCGAVRCRCGAGIEWRCNQLQHATPAVAACHICTMEVVCFLSVSRKEALHISSFCVCRQRHGGQGRGGTPGCSLGGHPCQQHAACCLSSGTAQGHRRT